MLYHGITPRFLVAVAFSKTKARANKISTFFKAIVSMLIREREREKRERERERERGMKESFRFKYTRQIFRRELF